MRRFSIARLMFFVAFLAANFGAVRLFMSPEHDQGYVYPLMAGFIPLIDALILVAYGLLARFRLSLRRRSVHDRGGLALRFLLIGGSLLVAGLALLAWYPMPLLEGLERAWPPMEQIFVSLGMQTRSMTPSLRYVIAPACYGVTLSGPPILLALALAAILSRFQVVVTPRAEAPCADSRS